MAAFGTLPVPADVTTALTALRADPRARCRGHAPDYDDQLPREQPADRAARHARAVTRCHDCPVVTLCDTVANHLGRSANGVWAGHLRSP